MTRRALALCAAADAAAAVLISWRSGITNAGLLAQNAAAGVLIGTVTALVVSVLILRLHSIGYVLSAAILIGLLVLTAWLATDAEFIVLAATFTMVIPLYTLAAALTCLTVHPPHPDWQE